jgi:tetratricopeptide (TPR) repeat protein
VEKALSINPNNEVAYQGRSVYYLAKKQFQQSLADANLALQINTSSPDSYALQGMSYVGLGDRSSAKNALQKSAILYQRRGLRAGYQNVTQALRLLR